MKQPKYDAIIVGGGPSGSLLAKNLGEEGFKIALVDNKKKPLFWDKVCGSVASNSLVNRLKLDENEVLNEFNGFQVRDLSGEYLSEITVELIVLDRVKTGAKVIEEIEDYDVDVLDKRTARYLILDSKGIKGVELEGPVGEGGKLLSRLTVDATGVEGVLREQLKGKLPEHTYSEYDLINAYIEKLTVDSHSFEKFHLFISREKAPGGYLWVTPVSEKELIVGVGGALYLTSLSDLRQAVADLKMSLKLNGKVTMRGEGILPVRRPFYSFVYDGFAMVGDSASQGNPFFGGGIEGAADAADIAGKSIRKALETSTENIVPLWDLWVYNYEFHSRKGSLLAMVDLLRMLAQSLDDKELTTIAKNMPKSLQFDLPTLLSVGLKLSGLIFRPRFLWKTVELVKVAQKVRDVYKDYPNDPESLEKWIRRVEKVFKKYRKTINKM